ncbi:MAG: DUF4132 domain-containing protein [Myxococcota bacterium]|nr:DUF4132 domain-containing protein [Myxococcota bacterium]MEC9440784.1 DUF4132 domain-containing protein [Myxococcota bacterium]
MTNETKFPTWAEELGDFHEFADKELEYNPDEEHWPTARKQQSFDQKSAIERFKEILRTEKESYPQYKLWNLTSQWQMKFNFMTDDEARFWLYALTDTDAELDVLEKSKVIPRLEAFDPSEPIDAKVAGERLENVLYEKFGGTPPYYYYDANRWGPISLLLRQLYGVEETFTMILERVRLEDSGSFFDWFGPTKPEERARLIEIIEDKVDEAQFDGTNYSILYYAAPSLLKIAPSQKFIRKVYDTFIARGSRWWHQEIPKLVLFLEDDEILHYSTKLGFKYTPAMLRHLFIRFGIERASELLDFATKRPNKANAPELLPVFYKIHSRGMVARMLELAQSAATMDPATHWLQNEGINAIDGMIELVGRQGKKRRWAIEQLRVLSENGHNELIESLLENHKATAQKLVRQEVLDFEQETFDDLPEDQWPAIFKTLASDYALTDEDRSFFAFEQAPVMLFAGTEHAIPARVVEGLLGMCKVAHPVAAGKRKQPAAVKKLVKELLALRPHFEEERAGDWVWYLFERWWAQETPEENSWFIWLLGYLGTSAQATLLLKRIKAHTQWFGRVKGRNASKAIQSLRHIDTRQAYTTLFLISTGMQNARLRGVAQREIEALKQEKGWDDNQLQDRIVPDAGLDKNGTYIFDYGPRQFKLYFRGAFDIEFVDEEGNHFSRIPAVRKSDEVDKVTAAKESYKVIRQQILDLVKVQTERLENALLEGRVWPKADWEEYILSHPLMMHFARKLIWCTCDSEGRADAFFLPSEDQSCVGTDYEPVPLSKSHVRLCHPAELSDEARLEWSELMTDFEIVQPFDQLQRPVFRPGDEGSEVTDRVGEIFEGRWSWYVQDTTRRQLGENWSVRTINYNPAMVMRDLFGVRIVILIDNQGWVIEEEGAKTPSYKKGVYFLEAHQLDPKKYRIKDKDVPPAVYSEAIVALRKFAQAWGKL